MHNDKLDLNWTKIPVRRERRHEPLIERFCKSHNGSRPAFTYIKDLMVFAAMIGYSKQISVPVSSDSISIILETYASDNKDAFIYLLALMENENAACLKDENLSDSVRVFEGYCNAGLDEIQLWLNENACDPDGIETLLDKVYEQAIKNESDSQILNDEIEVDF